MILPSKIPLKGRKMAREEKCGDNTPNTSLPWPESDTYDSSSHTTPLRCKGWLGNVAIGWETTILPILYCGVRTQIVTRPSLPQASKSVFHPIFIYLFIKKLVLKFYSTICNGNLKINQIGSVSSRNTQPSGGQSHTQFTLFLLSTITWCPITQGHRLLSD